MPNPCRRRYQIQGAAALLATSSGKYQRGSTAFSTISLAAACSRFLDGSRASAVTRKFICRFMKPHLHSVQSHTHTASGSAASSNRAAARLLLSETFSANILLLIKRKIQKIWTSQISQKQDEVLLLRESFLLPSSTSHLVELREPNLRHRHRV